MNEIHLCLTKEEVNNLLDSLRTAAIFYGNKAAAAIASCDRESYAKARQAKMETWMLYSKISKTAEERATENA